MPTIGAAVSAEIKERFEAVALARSLTSSRLAGILINDFLAQSRPESLQAEQPSLLPQTVQDSSHGCKTEKVSVRLEPYYYAELGRRAAERGWYRSTYLANLFYAHVDRRAVLCEAEINALRHIARQLADLGRNVNQITHKLNTSAEHAHLVAAIDFELIKMLLDLESNAVRALIKANLHGWGVIDAET
jgi:hypothetical protein